MSSRIAAGKLDWPGVHVKTNLTLAETSSDPACPWTEALRLHDSDLYRHSIFVSELAAAFSSYLGFAPEDQILLTRAALLHDVGKTSIPADLLRKPAALNPSETSLMQSHPATGYRMLVEEGGHHAYTLAIANDHHERLDGTGYPRGLLAAQISEPVRIVTLCDIYAAMTEPRPYAPSLQPHEALAAMKTDDTGLDSRLMDQFAAMIRTVLPIVQRAESGA